MSGEPRRTWPLSAPPAAVLLDRDGTLITETGYLTDPGGFEFVPGAPQALARLNAAGVPVALVTNQSAIARGWLTPGGLEQIHAELQRQLSESRAHLDLILHCPHHPTEGPGGAPGPFTTQCECRKPLPGLLLQALTHFGAAAEQSVTVGDSDRDLEAGERAGVRGLLVCTGKGRDQWRRSLARTGRAPDCVPDLSAAVDLLLPGA